MQNKLAFKYAIKDLRGAFAAFRIVLLCLVLGVGAIASVQFISRSVLDSVTRDGQTILGADIMVRHLNMPAPDTVRDWFTTRGATLSETIETRVMLANAESDDNTLVELKGVDAAYPLYGQFESDAGNDLYALLQGSGIVLDEALRERLELNVGDDARLGSQTFKVRGFIVNEPDRAGGSRFGLAPRAVVLVDDLARTGLIDTGSMLGYELRARLPMGADVDGVRDALEADFADANFRVMDAGNASPRLTSFIERLMLFLTLVGMSALLVGGIGIGNGVRAYLETRTNTIAILKAIGTPVRLIERMYAIQILLVALAGTAVGVLIGVLAPYFAVPMLSQLLPFSVQPTLSLSGFLVPVLLGLLIVFAFTLWPLGAAVGASPLNLFRSVVGGATGAVATKYKLMTGALVAVLAALAVGSARDMNFAIWFVVGALFCLCVFWLIGVLIAFMAGRVRVPRAPVLRLALRNLHRPGNASAGTLVSLGLGLTVLMSVTLIELNLRQGIAQNLPDDAPAFFFLDIQGHQRDGFESLLSGQTSVENIKFAPNLRGRIVSVNGVPADKALVDETERWLLQNDRGFTYTAELPGYSKILSGEWWDNDYAGPPLISVVEDVVRAFGVGVGDEITVNIMGRDIVAKIANTRSVNWMDFSINYAITFAPGVLEAAPHGYLATVVADKAAENDIQRAIGRAYPNITMIRLSEAVEAAGSILGNMAKAVRMTALVAVITGIFVLAGSLAATRTQRLYDVVVLKVLGVRGRILIRGFMVEFGLLGILAGGVSLLLGGVISWAVMVHLMQLGWHFYAVPALIIGCSGLVLTLLIGWLVTGRVLSAPAAPYLRNE